MRLIMLWGPVDGVMRNLIFVRWRKSTFNYMRCIVRWLHFVRCDKSEFCSNVNYVTCSKSNSSFREVWHKHFSFREVQQKHVWLFSEVLHKHFYISWGVTKAVFHFVRCSKSMYGYLVRCYTSTFSFREVWQKQFFISWGAAKACMAI
jgi:hypothetical protein